MSGKTIVGVRIELVLSDGERVVWLDEPRGCDIEATRTNEIGDVSLDGAEWRTEYTGNRDAKLRVKWRDPEWRAKYLKAGGI